MALTLDDIDLLEDTWAAGVPVRAVRSVAPGGAGPSGTTIRSTAGFWAVTRHADVRPVSRDHDTFSTELGSTFITRLSRGGRSRWSA